jgi:hypothetical protein
MLRRFQCSGSAVRRYLVDLIKRQVMITEDRLVASAMSGDESRASRNGVNAP